MVASVGSRMSTETATRFPANEPRRRATPDAMSHSARSKPEVASGPRVLSRADETILHVTNR